MSFADVNRVYYNYDLCSNLHRVCFLHQRYLSPLFIDGDLVYLITRVNNNNNNNNSSR